MTFSIGGPGGPEGPGWETLQKGRGGSTTAPNFLGGLLPRPPGIPKHWISIWNLCYRPASSPRRTVDQPLHNRQPPSDGMLARDIAAQAAVRVRTHEQKRHLSRWALRIQAGRWSADACKPGRLQANLSRGVLGGSKQANLKLWLVLCYLPKTPRDKIVWSMPSIPAAPPKTCSTPPKGTAR